MILKVFTKSFFSVESDALVVDKSLGLDARSSYPMLAHISYLAHHPMTFILRFYQSHFAADDADKEHERASTELCRSLHSFRRCLTTLPWLLPRTMRRSILDTIHGVLSCLMEVGIAEDGFVLENVPLRPISTKGRRTLSKPYPASPSPRALPTNINRTSFSPSNTSRSFAKSISQSFSQSPSPSSDAAVRDSIAMHQLLESLVKKMGKLEEAIAIGMLPSEPKRVYTDFRSALDGWTVETASSEEEEIETAEEEGNVNAEIPPKSDGFFPSGSAVMKRLIKAVSEGHLTDETLQLQLLKLIKGVILRPVLSSLLGSEGTTETKRRSVHEASEDVSKRSVHIQALRSYLKDKSPSRQEEFLLYEAPSRIFDWNVAEKQRYLTQYGALKLIFQIISSSQNTSLRVCIRQCTL